MTRKLLPYEHQLIEALGVSKEEYLEFLCYQQEYTDIKVGTQLDIRNWPAVAIVLTVVGVLFQVAAALLAPKPQIPGQKNALNSRQQRFAPRFGFNNVQELGKYGDPVNLIYCNDDSTINPNGGVRAATSLVWSSVTSYGSSQYMQTLMLIGAGIIGQIDFTRSAFGQTPIRQFAAQKTWTYYNSNGNVRFSNIVYPAGDTNDPTYTSSADLVYRINRGGTITEGFSQSFSPSSLTTLGVYAPIPIKILIKERDEDGDVDAAQLKIEISNDDSFTSTYWGTSRPLIPVGTRLRVRFGQADASRSQTVALAAEEDRFNYFSRIDAASTYKLGSATFRLDQPLLSNDLSAGPIIAVFKCIESGICPGVDYSASSYDQVIKEWKKEREALRARNAEIRTILLNPPPIYDPIVFGSLNSDLDGIQVTIDQLEEYVEAIRNGGKLDGISAEQRRSYLVTLSTEALSDPVVAVIAQDIIEREDNLINDDTLTKSQRRSIKREIKKLERELTRAIEQYGFREGIVVSPRTGLPVKGRDEIRIIQRLISTENRRAFQRLIDRLGATGGGRNLDAEAARNATLNAEIDANQARIAELKLLIEGDGIEANDFFSTKCMAKVEEAAYQVITDCRVVRFSLKAKVFQRISGRASEYGEANVDEYKLSDNGLKFRTAMFWMWYRETSTSAYKRVPTVFGIRRRADVESFIDLTFVAPTNGTKWEFRFEPIVELPAELKKAGLPANYQFVYLESNGPLLQVANGDGTSVYFMGQRRGARSYFPPIEKSPYGVSDWGLFSARGDTQISYSFESGPEISLMAVTEQREEALSAYPGLYQNMALVGFNAYSGQGVQDLRSFTVFVKKGKLVRRLNDDGTVNPVYDTPTSYAPEIFLDTATDKLDGIGQYTTEKAIDLKRLALAKKFCRTNKLFFDGIITEAQSWREFWAEVAPFSLLELARIGGKETLVPALPVDDAGNILYSTPIKIEALFNAGNILEDSYKEEFIDYGSDSQDLIANVIYRYTEASETFPRNRSVEVRRSDVTDLTGIRQTFDLSSYVTSRNQAILFAKMLCQQKRYIRRNIEFQTFPTDTPLYPGAFIYVEVGNSSWEGIYSGRVEAGGELNVPLTQVVNGSYSVLLYKSGQTPVSTTASVSNGIASSLAGYDDWLFVLGTQVQKKRVFRVAQVELGEEGEVTVRATEHPTNEQGRSLINCVANASGTIIESITADYPESALPSSSRPFLVSN